VVEAAGYVRRAGRATLQNGSVLLWSIAEGRRGARWRACTRGPGGLLSDLLLEVGSDGRPARLEIATPAGLLTLHPEPDGRSAHGNVVRPDGVDPLAFEWTEHHWFESRQSPVVAAAMVRALRSGVGVGAHRVVPGLHVDDDLRVWRGVRGVERMSETRWSIEEATGFGWELSLDDEGLPIFEAGEVRTPDSAAAPVWPLEVDDDVRG
jgi:hypothetical protein